MLFYYLSLSLLTVAWGWGYGGSEAEYYAPYCDHIECLQITSKVCAKSRITKQEATFDNACEVQRFSCLSREPWRVINLGTCDCPTGCPRKYKPVCAILGSTWRTFDSSCELRKEICSSGQPWRQEPDEICKIVPDVRPYSPYGVPYYGPAAYAPFHGVPPAYGPHVYESPAYHNVDYYNSPPNPYDQSQMLPYHIHISRDSVPTESSGASNLAATESSVSSETETSSSSTSTEPTTDVTSTTPANKAPKLRRTSKIGNVTEDFVGKESSSLNVTSENPKATDDVTTPEATTEAPLSSSTDSTTEATVKPTISVDSTTAESTTATSLNTTSLSTTEATTIRTEFAIAEKSSEVTGLNSDFIAASTTTSSSAPLKDSSTKSYPQYYTTSSTDNSKLISSVGSTEVSLNSTSQTTLGSTTVSATESTTQLKMKRLNKESADDTTTSVPSTPQYYAPGYSSYPQDNATPSAVNSKLAPFDSSTEAPLNNFSSSENPVNSTTNSTTASEAETTMVSTTSSSAKDIASEVRVQNLSNDSSSASPQSGSSTYSQDYTTPSADNSKLVSSNISTEASTLQTTLSPTTDKNSELKVKRLNKESVDVMTTSTSVPTQYYAPGSSSYPQYYTSPSSVNSELASSDSPTEAPSRVSSTEAPLNITSSSTSETPVNTTIESTTSSPVASVDESASKLRDINLRQDSSSLGPQSGSSTYSQDYTTPSDISTENTLSPTTDKSSELKVKRLNKESTDGATTSVPSSSQYYAVESSPYPVYYTTPSIVNSKLDSSDTTTEVSLSSTSQTTDSNSESTSNAATGSTTQLQMKRLNKDLADDTTTSGSLSYSQDYTNPPVINSKHSSTEAPLTSTSTSTSASTSEILFSSSTESITVPQIRAMSKIENRSLGSDNNTASSIDPSSDSTTKTSLDTTTVSTPESQDRAVELIPKGNSDAGQIILQMSEDDNAQTVRINNGFSNSVWIIFLPSAKGKPVNIVKQN